MNRNVIEMTGISKTFPGVKALDHVDLSLIENEILGLVGENGAGKTTLMKILLGVYKADSGKIMLDSTSIDPESPSHAADLGLHMVFQEMSLIPNLTVYENIFLGRLRQFENYRRLNLKAMRNEAQEILDDLKYSLDPRSIVGNLTMEKRIAVEVARTFSWLKDTSKKHIIVLDETTATLTPRETKPLFERIDALRKKGLASFIFISHRISEVIDIADRIQVLKDGVTTAILDQHEKKTTESELHRLMTGRPRDVEYYKEDKQRNPSKDLVLSVENLTSEGAFQDITFQLHKGEILSIAGVTGSGKTELGKAIFGAQKIHSGHVKVRGKTIVPKSPNQMINLNVSYLSGDKKNEGLILGFPVSWNMTLASLKNINYENLPILNLGKEEQVSKEYVKTLGVVTPSIKTLCFSLSGGNQQKVAVAKWLIRNFDVLVADNPTRGVDVGAKEDIYDLFRELVERGASILLISDDLLEVIGLSNKIITMKDGKITRMLETPPHNKPSEPEIIQYLM